GLVHGLGDVSRVFAVHLQRKRVVAADDDAIEITGGMRLPLLEAGASYAVDEDARNVSSPQAHGSEVREPRVEIRARNEVQRLGAGKRIRRAVRDEHERGASGSLHLELLVEARIPRPEHA